MRIIVVILTTCFMQVSAAGFAQKLTLSKKRATLEQIFTEIRKQTGYYVVYAENKVDKTAKLDVNFNNADLRDVLDVVSKSQNLEYSFDERNVSLKPKEPSFLDRVVSAFQSIDLRGIVVDSETGQALVGASVKVKGTNRVTTTGSDGSFFLSGVDEDAMIVVSFIGYVSKELKAKKDLGEIRLVMASADLNEVDISVNTGYQVLPKERATGSFDFVDNELLNRRVSSDVISRLEGVVPGMVFNRNSYQASRGGLDVSIRGRSTIFGNDQPLIVLDNFPYDGDINNLNPNDIESVTVLKDAAAASIWGTKAGNGVIVITTKRGKLNQKMDIEVNSNVTISEKPDVFYDPRFLNADEFIDLEKELFTRNYYNADINNVNRPPLSPVVEILNRQKLGQISEIAANTQIDELRKYDYRNDINKYLYRKGLQQQYALNLKGGSSAVNYFLSFGYNRNLGGAKGNESTRSTINSFANFYPVKNLEISANINYVQNSSQMNSPLIGSTLGINSGGSKLFLYPYARLADEKGNPLAVVKDYRYSYIDSVGKGKLLDWKYRPLEEVYISDNTSTNTDARINIGAKYSFLEGLSGEVRYQYERGNTTGRNYQSEETYFTRNEINKFSQILSNGIVSRPIPQGGILNNSNSLLQSNRFRTQFNADKIWNRHQLNALVGAEINEVVIDGSNNRLYGYNDLLAINNTKLDFLTLYPLFINSTSAITNVEGVSQATDRYLSYFGNAAYSYKNRYVLSASARIDKSNLFGVRSNQKAVPLYSVGIGWNINEEDFYHISFLPYLKLRFSHGYNGNVDKSITAYATSSASANTGTFGLPFATLTSPANPDLRWEKTKINNLGVDFSTKRNIFSGSIDLYIKKGVDLIGDMLIPPSSGYDSFRANQAQTNTNGLDIAFNLKLTDKLIKWTSALLFNYVNEKVTKYDKKSTTSIYVNNGYGAGSGSPITGKFPLEGKPLFAVYSYKWGGLDPQTGDPRGYLNGQLSNSWAQIITNTSINDVIYHGSATPTIFGSFRNDIKYKQLSLSLNLIYKFGYFFKAGSVNYSSSYNAWNIHEDYSRRWKKPGDEEFTNVPSIIYPPVNSSRDLFYNGSEVLVHKGDHIRLQDIGMNYEFTKRQWKKMPFKSMQLSGYANNIGIVWKMDKSKFDPDAYVGQIPATPLVRTFSFGCKIIY